jgi:hypothetical protein
MHNKIGQYYKADMGQRGVACATDTYAVIYLEGGGGAMGFHPPWELP